MLDADVVVMSVVCELLVVVAETVEGPVVDDDLDDIVEETVDEIVLGIVDDEVEDFDEELDTVLLMLDI